MLNIAESHKAAIGCSKIAQALGLSAHGSRFDLWQEYTGRKERDDIGNHLRVALGTPMEDVLKPFVEERLGRELRRDRRVYSHDSLPLIAHLDFRASKLAGETVRPVVDTKTSLGWGAKHRFGVDGSDEVDNDVLLQMQGYNLLTGANVAYVAALVPGPELKIYTVESDPELHDMIEDGIADFWRCVTTDTPPEPLNESEARQRWPSHSSGKTLDVAEDVMLLIKDFASIKRRLAEGEKQEKAIRDKLLPKLADADTVTYDGYTLLTYRANKDSQKTDWSKLAMAVMAWADLGTDQKAAWLDKFTTTQPGARVLRLAKTLEIAE